MHGQEGMKDRQPRRTRAFVPSYTSAFAALRATGVRRLAVGPYSSSSHAPLRPHKRDDDASAARLVYVRQQARVGTCVQLCSANSPRGICAESIGRVPRMHAASMGERVIGCGSPLPLLSLGSTKHVHGERRRPPLLPEQGVSFTVFSARCCITRWCVHPIDRVLTCSEVVRDEWT